MAFTPPKLAPHQRLAADFIKQTPKCGIFLGIGAAKTLTTLTALYEIAPPGHILVVAPLAIARSTWLDEIDKWGFPLRTKSLIVDENDKKLNRTQRIEAFKQIKNDPPTMYFISNELLKQPSLKTTLLSVSLGAFNTSAYQNLTKDPKRAPMAATVALRVISDKGPIEIAQIHSHPTMAQFSKSAINSGIALLRKNHLIEDFKVDCQFCNSRGCANCAAGLFDQLPPRKELIGYRRNGARVFRNTVEWPFTTMIIDESQSMKSHTSTRFKTLAAVAPQTTRIIELTGTPRPNNALDLWSQMFLLDQGASLGDNYFNFRSRFFHPTKKIDGIPVGWEPIKDAEEQIHKLCAPFVMSASTIDIPMPKVDYDTNTRGIYPANKVNVTLSKDLMDAYKSFARNQIISLSNPDPNDPTRRVITADSAAIMANKLIQFASGTMYLDSDEDSGVPKGAYAVIHDEKLRMLLHLVENADGNVIVGYRYRAEREEIAKYLKAQGIGAEIFDGSRDMVRRWNNKEIPVLLMHPASGGPGLNLQDGGHELIWFTLPDSSEHFSQLNGRLIRPGQKNSVRVDYLATKGTRDATIASRILRPKLIGQSHLIDTVSHDDALDLADELFSDLGLPQL